MLKLIMTSIHTYVYTLYGLFLLHFKQFLFTITCLLVGEGIFRGLQCCLYINTAALSEERLWKAADRV